MVVRRGGLFGGGAFRKRVVAIRRIWVTSNARVEKMDEGGGFLRIEGGGEWSMRIHGILLVEKGGGDRDRLRGEGTGGVEMEDEDR